MHHFTYFFAFGLIIIIHHNIDSVVLDQKDKTMYKITNFQPATYTILPERVIIRTGQRRFNISLHDEESIFSLATKVFIHKNNKIRKLYQRNVPGSSIYEGTIEGVSSSVIGYFYDDMFVGNIKIGREVFYFEPIDYHPTLTGYYTKSKSIFYSLDDVSLNYKYHDGKPVCEEAKDESFLRKNNFKNNRNSHIFNVNSSNGYPYSVRHERLCSLEFLVDHTYFQHMRSNHGKIVAEMLYYAKIADTIFRNSDINGDGKPDGIGFNVEKITIFENKNESGYLLGGNIQESEEFLDYLSQYSHPYCMLICFCHRDFWTESQCAIGKAKNNGIICQGNNSKNYAVGTNNVIFITNLERGAIIPRFRISLNLVHQLGHAFGSLDDPMNNDTCSPGDLKLRNGNYIMHPKVPFGAEKNNWKFSRCSLYAMREFINKDNCLKKIDEATCGNKIVEEGESCDCDPSDDQCKECCNPHGTLLQCSLKDKVSCSPDTGECCDKSCNIILSNQSKSCINHHPSDNECRSISSFCDGTSPFCVETIKPDGTSCSGTKGICLSGKCYKNICEYRGLVPCKCPFQIKCQRCCTEKYRKFCQTAREFNIFPSIHHLHIKTPGTFCNNYRGKCSSEGICERIDIFIHILLHYVLPLICVTLIMIALSYFLLRFRTKYALKKMESKESVSSSIEIKMPSTTIEENVMPKHSEENVMPEHSEENVMPEHSEENVMQEHSKEN